MTIKIKKLHTSPIHTNSYVEISVVTNVVTKDVYFTVKYMNRVNWTPTTKTFENLKDAMSWAKSVNKLANRTKFTKQVYRIDRPISVPHSEKATLRLEY